MTNPKKPSRGRPRTLPPGAKIRMMRLTDDEHAACKELVAKMRKRKPRKQLEGKRDG